MKHYKIEENAELFHDYVEKNKDDINIKTSISETMLSGRKRGVRMTISDVLESYDDVNETNKPGDL